MDYLLFDLDNTLLDFSAASKSALWQTFSDFGGQCDEEIYAVYQAINHQVWQAFEQQKLSAEELRPLRFARLQTALQLDLAAPERWSKTYLDNLVLLSEAYEGVPELLAELAGQHHLAIITNGLQEVQRPRLERLGLTQYFDTIVVSDEIGVAKPQAAFFAYTQTAIGTNPAPDEMLVIGDSLQSDIKGGNDFGTHACWIRHDRTNDSAITPDHSIADVHDLKGILGAS